MKLVNREDVQIIVKHSNVHKAKVAELLNEHVHAKQKDWQKFLRLLFISLGVGFVTAGIIFFFAYNWDELNKFIKLALVQGLVVASSLIVVFSRVSPVIKNITLTGAAMLVGLLFAVFGQIYQTGANAYDFFLAWTIFITLWVLISRFSPMYLLFILLINTTLVLYSQQFAPQWSSSTLTIILLLLNTAFLCGMLFLQLRNQDDFPAIWLTHLISLAITAIAVIGIIINLSETEEDGLFLLTFVVFILFGIGVWHGFSSKKLFYLAVIFFGIIITISAFIIDASQESASFFFVSIFIMLSVTFLIYGMIKLQKEWTKSLNNES